MMWKNWTRSSRVHQEITVCKNILKYDKWMTTGRLFNSSSYVGSGVFLEAAEWTTVVSWETKTIVEITVSGASRTRVWLQWAWETSPWSQVHKSVYRDCKKIYYVLKALSHIWPCEKLKWAFFIYFFMRIKLYSLQIKIIFAFAFNFLGCQVPINNDRIFWI